MYHLPRGNVCLSSAHHQQHSTQPGRSKEASKRTPNRTPTRLLIGRNDDPENSCNHRRRHQKRARSEERYDGAVASQEPKRESSAAQTISLAKRSDPGRQGRKSERNRRGNNSFSGLSPFSFIRNHHRKKKRENTKNKATSNERVLIQYHRKQSHRAKPLQTNSQPASHHGYDRHRFPSRR